MSTDDLTQETPPAIRDVPPLPRVEPGSYLAGEQRGLVAEAAAAHYRAGASIGDIAKQLSLSRSTTINLILSTGTTIRDEGNHRETQFDAIIARLHSAGRNSTAIGYQISRSRHYVVRRLAALGLYEPGQQHSMPPPDASPDPLPRLGTQRLRAGAEREALVALVVAHYRSDRSIRQIAADLGRSFGFVHRLLDGAGEPHRRRGGRCGVVQGGQP